MNSARALSLALVLVLVTSCGESARQDGVTPPPPPLTAGGGVSGTNSSSSGSSGLIQSGTGGTGGSGGASVGGLGAEAGKGGALEGGATATPTGGTGGSTAQGGTPDTGGTGGSTCALSVWYADTDGDGFGDPLVSQDSCVPPDGHVSNPDDCYDGNAEARPGPRPPFPPVEHEEDRGDGSWDYDCDGEETLTWTELGTCPDASTEPITPGTVGWWDGPVPDCGESGSRKVNAAACPGALLSIVQQCK